MSDMGQSGDTFHAIMEYAKQSRPRLILLENVRNANWTNRQKPCDTYDLAKYLDADIDSKKKNKQKIDYPIDQLLFSIDYVATPIKVDTRDYYLPQTRERTYMLCVDGRIFNDDKDFADQKQKYSATTKAIVELDRWTKVMEFLQHPASCPVETMLLTAAEETARADLFIEEAFLVEELGVKTLYKDDLRWRSTQKEYREDLGLGQERKLTSWNEGGYKLYPDFWTPLDNMTQRHREVAEISHLRGITRGFDDRYYG